MPNFKNYNGDNIEDSLKNEINTFLNAYYDDFTGLYLKSKDFLRTIVDTK